MANLLAAAAFLLLSHFGLSSTSLRPRLVARLGTGRYLLVYALIAALAFVWLIAAYRGAPYLPLWPAAPWLAWLPLLIVPLAAILVVGSLTTRNPTAVGQPALDEAEAPAQGMLRITRHPFMWGAGLWALAHLVANGDLAALILFGSLAALALVGTLLLDAKFAARDPLRWQRFAMATSNLPFAAILAGRQRLVPAEIGWRRIALGLALYALLLALHPWLFGVSPFPV